jgi:hypothetical protein
MLFSNVFAIYISTNKFKSIEYVRNERTGKQQIRRIVSDNMGRGGNKLRRREN